MTQQPSCPICKRPAEARVSGQRDAYTYDCPACGRFEITGTAVATFQHDSNWGSESHRLRAIASGFIREQGAADLSSDSLRGLTEIPSPTRQQKKLKILRAIKRHGPHAGDEVSIRWDDPKWLAIGWCAAPQELGALVRELHDEDQIRGAAHRQNHVFLAQVTGAGEQTLDDAGNANLTSRSAFIAMAFREDVEDAHRSIREAISKAGYIPVRVDDSYALDRIDDRIMQMIRTSRFIVADLTHHRGGVYFEAGFAFALRIPVIFSCRCDDIENMHFDVRQHQAIVWTTASQLEQELEGAIRSALWTARDEV